MNELRELIGVERSLERVASALHFGAKQLGPPVTGAMHITCADESEHECIGAFQRGFVHYMLPPLKFAQASPFRLANLGGVYEWGAIRIAEHHYATEASHRDYKLLMVKVNAHVAATQDAGSRPTPAACSTRFRAASTSSIRTTPRR